MSGELREKIARIVYAAMWPDNAPAVPWEHIENVMAKAPILEAADLILAELDGSVLLDVVKVLEPEGEGSAGADIAASACGLTAGEAQRKSKEGAQ